MLCTYVAKGAILLKACVGDLEVENEGVIGTIMGTDWRVSEEV